VLGDNKYRYKLAIVLKKMKRVALGTARLSGGTQHEEVVHVALREGIRVIDTAASYGGGASETLIGKVCFFFSCCCWSPAHYPHSFHV
jgi:diketogulonate reductase-like aldo/keto reductase